MSVLKKNNVNIIGTGQQTMIFAHGFGCDQNMWRFVTPAFADRYRVVLFDHVGAGHSDWSVYDPQRYSSLQQYADDLLEICRELDVQGGIFVGHSVAAIIGILAALKEPECFEKLILVGPSPRYIDDDEYKGGFSQEDIEGLLEFMDDNYLGWSNTMAPVIMGNPDRPGLGEELTNSFCRTDPEIARQFARVTFLSDNRSDLPKLTVPALILQCSQDVIAPEAVGRYMHSQLPTSELILLRARGHCPNLSAPEETIAAINTFL